MDKKYLQFFLILTVILILITKTSFASSNDRILYTDHFVIKYNIDNSNCAITLADRLESCHERICHFLEFDPSDKLNVIIYKQSNINFSNIIKSEELNELFIQSDGDFSDIDNLLYYKLFYIYLKKMVTGGNYISIIKKNFIESPLSGYTNIDKIITNIKINTA